MSVQSDKYIFTYFFNGRPNIDLYYLRRRFLV